LARARGLTARLLASVPEHPSTLPPLNPCLHLTLEEFLPQMWRFSHTHQIPHQPATKNSRWLSDFFLLLLSRTIQIIMLDKGMRILDRKMKFTE
jgi:hypothetical protein